MVNKRDPKIQFYATSDGAFFNESKLVTENFFLFKNYFILVIVY